MELLLVISLSSIFIKFSIAGPPVITDFPSPEISLSETVISETVLETIIVTDTDPYLCNIKQSTPDGPFNVWKKDGDTEYRVYYVVGSGIDKLDYNTIKEYDLVIECSDKDGSVTKNLKIKITGNEPPIPSGLPVVKTIDAKAAQYQYINSVIYNVSVTDPENDLLTYTMYSDPNLGYFKIDPYSGQIKSAIDLRSATVENIPLFINVTDGRNIIGPLKVTIKLKNINKRPVFTNLPADLTIKEDAPAGQVITVLSFTDEDPYQDLEPICSVKPANENYKFVFEKKSNKLRLSDGNNEPKPLDYESTKKYTITCSLYDGYLYNEEAILNLDVLDVNEQPYFEEHSHSCALYESKMGVSSCDLNLKTKDPDGDVVDIVLLSGNNSERFSLINDGQKLTFSIDYDTDEQVMPSEVLLTAGVIDDRGLTGTTKISVSVEDVNDNTPEFTSSVTSYVLSETDDLGSLGTVTALDRDSGSNGDVTYSVKGGSQALSYISVLSDGEIRYSNNYPESMGGKSETILIEAKDKGDPVLSSTATIIVAFQPYTTTTTTTTVKTIIVTQADSSSSSSSFSNNAASIGLLAALLSLLALAAIAALVYCLCCRAGGRCASGQKTVHTEKTRRVHYDDYDSRYYDRNYERESVLDYNDRRDRRGYDRERVEVRDGSREGSPYSASQVKLLGPRDLPRVV